MSDARSLQNRSILSRAVSACIEPLEQRVFLSVSLSATADTFVRNGDFADVNAGATTLLFVRNGNDGDQRIAFLKFDLSGVDQVTQATLNLSIATQTSAPALSTGIYAVPDTTWVEGTKNNSLLNESDGVTPAPIDGPADGMTWNTRPDLQGDAIDTVSVNGNEFSRYSFDVTSYLQSEKAAGHDIVSLAVRPTEQQDFREQFAARDFGNEDVPSLVIDDSGGGGNVDQTAPSSSVSAPDVTSAGGSSTTVTVIYSDDVGIKASSITTDNLTIAGPNGPLDVTNVERSSESDAQTITAVYTVAAPGGDWGAHDNGVYAISLNDGVTDTSGNKISPTQTSFRVNIPDTTAPDATLSVGNVTVPGATQTITVTYSDNIAVDASSINGDDLSVSGGLGVTLVSLSPNSNGSPLVATYAISAPGGSWDFADNGNYTVTLNAGNVTDTSNNGVAGQSKSFSANLPQVGDTQGPTASISVGDVNAPGGATHTVTVTYSDDRAVKASSIDVGDITVTGPGGPLTVTGVSISPSGDASPITATYTIAAPGGSWDAADNGNYTVTVANGAVEDKRHNPGSGASGSFRVNATVVDNSAPTASIGAPDVTTGGSTPQLLTVTYNDNNAIDLSSIGTDDLVVSGPNGPVVVSVVTLVSRNNNASVDAIYTLAAPDNSWDAADNGAYTVTLKSGAVRDASGNSAASVSGGFTVNVAAPQPVDPGFNGGDAIGTGFVVEAMTTQPDGKILVAGRRGDPSTGNAQAVLQRRNSDGTLDASFGSGGEVVSPSGANDAYYAIAMQGDRILVAGTSGGQILLARYDSSGHLDSSFTGGGQVLQTLGAANEAAYGMALAPDGRIVVTGGSAGNFAFIRYDANGLPDPTFGQGGKLLFDLGTDADVPGAVVVQSDGKIVAAGTSGTHVAVVRLTTDGSQDTTFSGDGLIMVDPLLARQDPGSIDRSIALALQADGRILVGNHTADGNFAIARIDTAGNIDSSFGNNGFASADLGGDDDADAVVLQSTGEILVVGTTLSGGVGSTGVAAFSSNGVPIRSFGNSGTLTVASDVTQSSRELHIGDLVLRAFGTRQPDGKLLVGTSDTSPTTTSSALRRLNVPGTRATPQGSSLGSFGRINGKNTRLVFTDADGTKITFSIKGGTGTAFLSGGKINLVLTSDGGAGCAVSIKARGGDGRVSLGDVTVNGALKSLSGKTCDLSGTLFAAGAIGKMTLGNVTGTIASASSIKSLSASSLTNARLLSGANLGSDAVLGGAGVDTDAFGQGFIGSVKVKGAITSSLIAAGLDPRDGTFLNGDDRVIGGEASLLKALSAKSADDSSRFVAGKFGKARLGKKVDLTTDPRFKIL